MWNTLKFGFLLTVTILACVHGQGYPKETPENPLVIPRPGDSVSADTDTGVLQTAVPPPHGHDHDHHHHYHGEDGKYNPKDDGRGWDIRKSVPGEPERDYPTYHKIPYTGFTCTSKPAGYYADTETRCQAFRICTTASERAFTSFLCPNGSLFNQQSLTCDWWQNVDCKVTDLHFPKEGEIVMPTGPALMEIVQQMLENPYKNIPNFLNDNQIQETGIEVKQVVTPPTTRKYYTPTVPPKTTPSYLPPVTTPTYLPPTTKPVYLPPITTPTYLPPKSTPEYLPPKLTIQPPFSSSQFVQTGTYPKVKPTNEYIPPKIQTTTQYPTPSPVYVPAKPINYPANTTPKPVHTNIAVTNFAYKPGEPSKTVEQFGSAGGYDERVEIPAGHPGYNYEKPELQISLPVRQDFKESTTKYTNNYHTSQATYPTTQTTYPTTQTTYPTTQTTYPTTQRTYPTTQRTYPTTQRTYPTTQRTTTYSTTHRTTTYPTTQRTYPETERTTLYPTHSNYPTTQRFTTYPTTETTTYPTTEYRTTYPTTEYKTTTYPTTYPTIRTYPTTEETATMPSEPTKISLFTDSIREETPTTTYEDKEETEEPAKTTVLPTTPAISQIIANTFTKPADIDSDDIDLRKGGKQSVVTAIKTSGIKSDVNSGFVHANVQSQNAVGNTNGNVVDQKLFTSTPDPAGIRVQQQNFGAAGLQGFAHQQNFGAGFDGTNQFLLSNGGNQKQLLDFSGYFGTNSPVNFVQEVSPVSEVSSGFYSTPRPNLNQFDQQIREFEQNLNLQNNLISTPRPNLNQLDEQVRIYEQNLNLQGGNIISSTQRPNINLLEDGAKIHEQNLNLVGLNYNTGEAHLPLLNRFQQIQRFGAQNQDFIAQNQVQNGLFKQSLSQNGQTGNELSTVTPTVQAQINTNTVTTTGSTDFSVIPTAAAKPVQSTVGPTIIPNGQAKNAQEQGKHTERDTVEIKGGEREQSISLLNKGVTTVQTLGQGLSDIEVHKSDDRVIDGGFGPLIDSNEKNGLVFGINAEQLNGDFGSDDFFNGQNFGFQQFGLQNQGFAAGQYALQNGPVTQQDILRSQQEILRSQQAKPRIINQGKTTVQQQTKKEEAKQNDNQQLQQNVQSQVFGQNFAFTGQNGQSLGQTVNAGLFNLQQNGGFDTQLGQTDGQDGFSNFQQQLNGQNVEIFGSRPLYEFNYDDTSGAGFGQNFAQNINANFGQNGNANFGQNGNSNFGQNSNTNFGQNINSNFGQNINPNFGQNINSNFGQNINTNFGQGVTVGAQNLGGVASQNFGGLNVQNLGQNIATQNKFAAQNIGQSLTQNSQSAITNTQNFQSALNSQFQNQKFKESIKVEIVPALGFSFDEDTGRKEYISTVLGDFQNGPTGNGGVDFFNNGKIALSNVELSSYNGPSSYLVPQSSVLSLPSDSAVLEQGFKRDTQRAKQSANRRETEKTR